MNLVGVSMPSSICLFLDTAPAMRYLYRGETRSFRQVDLVRRLLGKSYDAHDASEDARHLQLLVKEAIDTKPDNSLRRIFNNTDFAMNFNQLVNLERTSRNAPMVG